MAGSITPTQASQFSRHDRVVGLVEDTPHVDQFLALVPAAEILGYELRVPFVNSDNDQPLAAWIAEGGATTDRAAVPSTGSPRIFRLRRVYVDIVLDSLTEVIYSSLADHNIGQTEINAGLRALSYEIGEAMIVGDNSQNAAQPDGLGKLATDLGKVINHAGAALSLGAVDQVLGLVAANNGRANVLVMNTTIFRKWKQLWYTAGTRPRVETDPATGEEIYYHGDVRVAVNDWIPNTDDSLTRSSIYAVHLGWGTGFCMAFKSARGDGSMFEVERLMIAANDQHRYRISANVVFPVFSHCAIARLRSIDAA